MHLSFTLSTVNRILNFDMTPTYRAPLAIRFENLFAFIKQQIALADEKDAGRQTDSEMEKVESLRRLSNLLDLWASSLTVRRPTKESLVGDVLEAIDMSDPLLNGKLHRLISDIATHISKYVS